MSVYLDQDANPPLHAAVIDAPGFSADKPGGAQGVGALIVERKPRQPLSSGGDREQRRLGGSGHVAGIVGLGKSVELTRLEIEPRRHHLQQLRDVFETKLSADSAVSSSGSGAEAAQYELFRAALLPWRNLADGNRHGQPAGGGAPGSGIERH